MQKAIRIVAVILVVGLIGFLFVNGTINNNKNSREPWNEHMLKGDRETAKLYYYDYTDIMCPYCVAFENAIFENVNRITPIAEIEFPIE